MKVVVTAILIFAGVSIETWSNDTRKTWRIYCKISTENCVWWQNEFVPVRKFSGILLREPGSSPEGRGFPCKCPTSRIRSGTGGRLLQPQRRGCSFVPTHLLLASASFRSPHSTLRSASLRYQQRTSTSTHAEWKWYCFNGGLYTVTFIPPSEAWGWCDSNSSPAALSPPQRQQCESWCRHPTARGRYNTWRIFTQQQLCSEQ